MKESRKIADICIKALKNGNKIMLCGNGGSAADAQHIAAELVGKLNYNRPPLAAIALTTNSSVLTAIGNDYGFESVFSRQILALGKAGDVLIAISTSGTSPNILKAMYRAKKLGMNIILLTGKNAIKYISYYVYCAPSKNTQTIQEYHIKLAHEFCAIIE